MHACCGRHCLARWRGGRGGRNRRKAKEFRHVTHPEVMQGHEEFESIKSVSPSRSMTRAPNFVCASSSRHTPLSFASLFPITRSFCLSFSALCLMRFAFLSFLALLSLAGFSRRIWRPRTRLAYVPAGSVDWIRLDFTYVGVKGTLLWSLRRWF